jgi:hypothetical protein
LAGEEYKEEGEGGEGQHQDGRRRRILRPFSQRVVERRVQVHTGFEGAVYQLGGEDEADQKQQKGGFHSVEVEGRAYCRQAERDADVDAHIALGRQGLVPPI